MVVATSGSPPRRNLVDPILQEIMDYDSYLTTTFPGIYPSNLVFTNTHAAITHLAKFLQAYCQYAKFHDNSTSALALACPASWYNVDGTWKTGLLVGVAMDTIKTWPKYMYAYNKLRTPYINEDDRTLYTATATKLDALGFSTYIEKYKVAFETCSSVGVQTYSTEITGKTQYVHWYISGELFLLLASSLSFLWARVLKLEDESETPEAMADQQSEANSAQQSTTTWQAKMLGVLRWLHTTISVFLILALIVIIFFYCSKFYLQDLENDKTGSEYGKFITGFVTVYIILAGLGLLLSCFVFFKTIGMDIWHVCCGNHKDKKAEYSMLTAKSTINQEKVFQHMYLAQIALDLPVILGITFLAVATTLQRGVADYNLILTVIVLLTTTGLVTHIPNVLRLMHLQTQANAKGQITHDKNKMHSIRYNRVIIGLIIALMLVVFRNLAGLDSVQGSEFSALHQTWFAIVAFVIFVCGDLSLEAFAVFNRFKDSCDYVTRCVEHKSINTGWLIILGLWVLQLHQRQYFCPAYEMVGGDRPMLCTYF
jgi:hypothetical protein